MLTRCEPTRSRSSRGSARLRASSGLGCPTRLLDVEPAGLAVEDRLDPADEAVAVEDREDVVAVLALRRRDVHLEPVEEVPERLGAVAVVDEAVERREEVDARGTGPSSASGCATSRPRSQPHAERAEALLVVEPPRLRERRASRSRGYQRSARSQTRCLPCRPTTATWPRACEELEHEAHLALAPPAVVLTPVAGRVGDLAREQRPALAQLLQDMAAVGGAAP